MPYRSLSFFFAVFGSFLVVALILFGRDVRRAASTGPGWKRKLVVAGMALLGMMGITSGCGQGTGSGGVTVSATALTDPIPPDEGLEETRAWGHLTTVWREADEIGSGKRGDYPFDEKGKKRTLDDLAAVGGDLERLQAAGLLSEAEAGLLRKELALLTSRVEAKRPTEMRNATCYEPMPFTPARDSLDRLTDRLPLLEKLAGSETIQPVVVSKVLDTVERDLAVLQTKMRDQLPDNRKPEAKEAVRAAKAHLEKIRHKLERGAGALESSAQWRVVVAAWREATPLAVSGKSTTAEREAADRKIESAKRSIQALAEAGLLSKAESGLLISEAERLHGQIHRNPPTDSRVVCYDMLFLPPAQVSLQRLGMRLPLLKQLAAAGKVHPAALEKVLGSIEEDLRILSDEESLKPLPPEQQAQARELRKSAGAAVAEIKRILKESE